MVLIIVKVVVSIALGLFAGCAAIYIFNKMPAAWLTDYNEKPLAELVDPYIQRVKGFPWRWVYSAGFCLLLIRLSLVDIQFAVAGLFACFALLIIGLADLKYMIIPDQFVIMLAISALGFVAFHSTVTDPLLGAIIGGGALLMVAVLGAAAFKKEVMGFGDVKLAASIGLIVGIKGIVFILIFASLTSGVAAAISLAKKTAAKDDMKPLGPFICTGSAFYIFIIWPFLL